MWNERKFCNSAKNTINLVEFDKVAKDTEGEASNLGTDSKKHFLLSSMRFAI